MPEHTVRAGECITSIADANGFFWQTLWDHPRNTELRSLRGSPNVLLPGDVVFVPELRERWESGDDGNRHRFRKRGVPGVLRLRLVREPESGETTQSEETPYPPPDDVSSEDPATETQSEDEPRADVEVTVEIEGSITQTRTDSEGRLEVQIPPGAARGRLIIEPGTPRETVMPLAMGHLNPLSTIGGIRQRLANLGFGTGSESEEETPDLVAAIRLFQRRNGLEPTGEVTEETREAMRRAHGE